MQRKHFIYFVYLFTKKHIQTQQIFFNNQKCIISKGLQLFIRIRKHNTLNLLPPPNAVILSGNISSIT